MTALLEQFLRDYTEAVDGVWDEIEPQVYDMLWPDQTQPLRLTFDPEALPEHPESQLLTFGLPFLRRPDVSHKRVSAISIRGAPTDKRSWPWF